MPDLVDVEVQEIFFNRHMGSCGDIGVITLNRPKALNALTQTMCQAIHNALQDWQSDDSIKAVVIRGAGDKSFCAGGDIRQIYDNGSEQSEASQSFFRHEYRMNAAIHHFAKPYIALLDGITMGGGCGLSMHGQYRVATERLMLAMPETGIGFFPDVGGGHFLSRLPHHAGFYLGLTGNRINAADALYTGFATHYTTSDRLDDLVYRLTQVQWGENLHDTVTKVLADFNVPAGDSDLKKNQAILEFCFNQTSVADVLNALSDCTDKDSQAWCIKVLSGLSKKSPTSLLVTYEQLCRAANMDFNQAIAMEFNVVCHFLADHDFYEGVRAAIVDKDRSPKWQPGALGEVSSQTVDRYFTPIAEPLQLD